MIDDDDNDDNDDDYDDIYIMVKCLYVTKRHHFPYSKDFVVSPVYKHIPYSRDLVIFPVSRHFPYSKVSRNSKTTKSLEIMTFQGILLFLLFLDTFHIQGILSFYCF